MPKNQSRKTEGSGRSKKDILLLASIVVLCLVMAVLDIFKQKIIYLSDEKSNELLAQSLPLSAGAIAVFLLMKRSDSKLMKKPVHLLYLLPALAIAIDNFPFHNYFSGKSTLVYAEWQHWLLFAFYCAAVGLFEEGVFRGIVFPVMAGYFSSDRKGFLKTFFLSSVLFGVTHLFNLLAGGGFGATIMQAGYSILTGGLFAFVLIKTHNIFLCALVHGLYDFCGLLLPTLGVASSFDWQTCVTMAVVGVAVGVFVLYSVFKTTEEERAALYERLGFRRKAERGK